MRERVDQLGVAEPEIQRSGDEPDQRRPAGRRERRGGAGAGRPGRPAVLLRLGAERHRPRRQARADRPRRSPAARRPASRGGDPAVRGGPARRQARRRSRTATTRTTACSTRVDEKDKKVLAGPAGRRARSSTRTSTSRARATTSRSITAGARRTRRSSRSRRARSSSAPSSPTTSPTSEKGDEWYVLADNVALRGTDIKNPEQNFDQGAGGIGPADRHVRLHRRGPRHLAGRHARRSPSAASRSALPGTRRAGRRASTSRSCSTTSSSRRRSSTSSQNPNGIDGANGSQIEGGFTIESAQELANLLKTGALPVKLELISQSQVSATLGQQALDQGLVAGAAGFAHRRALPADLLPRARRHRGRSRCSSTRIYFFALIKLIPITLTLPGIAGLILTIGVAADANIVIFERVKEEIRAGRSVTAGLAAGYKKGLGGDHRRERRHDHGRVHPVRARDRGRQGLRVHARRRHDRLAVHRGAVHAGDRRHARHARSCSRARRRSARASSASRSRFDFMGCVEVVLLDVRRDPAHLRARASAARASTSASTSSRARGSAPRSSSRSTRTRSATCSRDAGPGRRGDPARRGPRASATTPSRSRPSRSQPDRGHAGHRRARRGVRRRAASPTRSRSARRSARPSRTARSSRSSRRCS